VTLTRVRATIVEVERQQELYILSLYLALGIQYAMRHIVIYGPPAYTTFFRIIS